MDGNRAFAHSRGDALHIPRANVADRKHAGKARFQHLRRTGKRPRRGSGCGIQIPPGEDEAFVIEGDAAPQPSVRGDAPAMMNTWRMSWTEVSPLVLSCQVTRSRCVSPSRPTISVL